MEHVEIFLGYTCVFFFQYIKAFDVKMWVKCLRVCEMSTSFELFMFVYLFNKALRDNLNKMSLDCLVFTHHHHLRLPFVHCGYKVLSW